MFGRLLNICQGIVLTNSRIFELCRQMLCNLVGSRTYRESRRIELRLENRRDSWRRKMLFCRSTSWRCRRIFRNRVDNHCSSTSRWWCFPILIPIQNRKNSLQFDCCIIYIFWTVGCKLSLMNRISMLHSVFILRLLESCWCKSFKRRKSCNQPLLNRS